ncbi:MAG: hypothetical protein ACOVN5_13075 [Aquidulcibacter sp.]|jgi:hypothetical protein
MTPAWKSNIETITPNLAAVLLETNTTNRKLRKSVVSKYADEMRNGDWLLTPEPIVIADTDRLLNGQHRLNAVIQYGGNVKMFVVRGVSEKAFSALDRGFSRSFADAHNVNKVVAELSKLLITVLESQHRSMSDKKVLEQVAFLSQNTEELIAFCPTNKKYFGSAPFRLAAVIHMFNPDARDHAMNMYRNFVLGHVQLLPPVGQALIGAFLAGRVGDKGGSYTARIESVMRAFSVFDPKNANMTRLPPMTGKNEMDNFMGAVLAAKHDRK